MELAQLTWNAQFDGKYGAADVACVGFCRTSPASAFYGANSIVQVSAVAQPGYVFKQWAGTGKAWTEAEASGGGGWIVSGAGQDLEGTKEPTIYINMGDGAAKPKPKDRELTAVFCPCIHGGEHNNQGYLKGASRSDPLPEGLGRYGADRDEDEGWDDWGCLLYIHKKLREVAAAWHDLNPGKPVRFNDISNAGGGPFDGHSSHQNGLDVDALYQSTIALSNQLIGMFANDSDIDTIYVGSGYATGGDIQFDADHFDHFHVRYVDPD